MVSIIIAFSSNFDRGHLDFQLCKVAVLMKNKVSVFNGLIPNPSWTVRQNADIDSTRVQVPSIILSLETKRRDPSSMCNKINTSVVVSSTSCGTHLWCISELLSDEF